MQKSAGRVGLEFESWVRNSLKRVGFQDVEGGPAFRVGGHQIDACGGHDDILLVAECTQSSSDDASIRDRISALRGKQQAIRKGFGALEKYRCYRHFEFAIVTRNIKYTDSDRTLALQRPRVHLFDVQILEYYERLASRIGKPGALFNFLGELQVQPSEFYLPRVPAFKVRLGKELPGYLFWCDPRELLKIAYVARRESGREKYYQRMVSAQRLGAIEKFINKGGIFPNNIIVTFDQKPQFRPKQRYDDTWPSWLEFGELIFPKSYRSCWVIDGQHRLYAFGRLPPGSSTQKVAVFAFEPLPEHQQAKFFIQINDEQKPVSKDLIWDLEGEMSPETPRGRIANCVKRLNSLPPLKDTIFLPLSGESKHGQLKMSGVCQDFDATGLLNERTPYMLQIQRNPLAYRVPLNHIPDKVATAVAAYLTQVKADSGEALWTGILLKPGGITVALNVYEQILIRVGQVPSDAQLVDYAKAFVQVLKDLAPNQSEMRRLVREQLTSYAQRRQLSADMLARMREILGDPEFAKERVKLAEPFGERLAKFERRLAEFVADRLGILDLPGLKQKAPEGVWKRVAEKVHQEGKVHPDYPVHQAFTLGETKEIAHRHDNARILMPLFTDPVDGFGDEQAVLAALNGIIRLRNAMDHGRRGGNRRLVTAYLETFERLIGS